MYAKLIKAIMKSATAGMFEVLLVLFFQEKNGFNLNETFAAPFSRGPG